jgi:hypothetical protein
MDKRRISLSALKRIQETIPGATQLREKEHSHRKMHYYM